MSGKYFAHSSAVIDDGAKIGRGTKIWHFSHIREEAVIGENCNLGQNVFVDNNAVIGNNCKIQNNCNIYEGVILEDYVFCGPSMTFTNDLTPRCKFPKTRAERVKTVVKAGATIGANCTVVCGCVIGENAMIGAGSVVTKDVEKHALMVGVPAVKVGYVCECGKKLDGGNRCSACGNTYEF